jgi:hypothetical protein
MPIVVGVTSGSSVGNYSGLIQLIIDTLKDPDLEDRIPAMIRHAEALFNRELYPLNDELTAPITTVSGTTTSALPDDFKKLRSLYKGTDTKAVLSQLSPDDLGTRYIASSNAEPEAFAIYGAAASLRWGPTPDAVYSYTCAYIRGIINLSQSIQTNWLIENHPDVYFHGTLMYAELDGWNDERSRNFAETTMEILAQIRRWDAQRRRGDNHAAVAGTYF